MVGRRAAAGPRRNRKKLEVGRRHHARECAPAVEGVYHHKRSRVGCVFCTFFAPLPSPPTALNTLHVYVHWGEMDSFQHLNNVHYLRYFESARVTYLAGSGWMDPTPNHQRPILAETQIKYRRQVVFPATLTLKTVVMEMREKGCTVGTVFLNGEEIVAEARAVALAFDYKLQKTVTMPKAFVDYSRHVDAFLPPEVKQRLLTSFKQ